LVTTPLIDSASTPLPVQAPTKHKTLTILLLDIKKSSQTFDFRTSARGAPDSTTKRRASKRRTIAETIKFLGSREDGRDARHSSYSFVFLNHRAFVRGKGRGEERKGIQVLSGAFVNTLLELELQSHSQSKLQRSKSSYPAKLQT
jgi:hypothetical protein